MTSPRHASFTVLCLFVAAGCGAADLEMRRDLAAAMASEHGWQHETIGTDTFPLAAWFNPEPSAGVLTVYVEGDGFAWATPRRPSLNPTPSDPVGLELALADGGSGVAYLARPCQYTDLTRQPECHGWLWTGDRFGEPVVSAVSQGIDALKERFRAANVALVGYSGGGSVAVLVASRRSDVTSVVTVAAPLDHELWTREKRLSPLRGSSNPVDSWLGVVNVPQIHYVGTADPVIDVRLAESFRSRFPRGSPIQVVTVEGFDHSCCWVSVWPKLLDGECPDDRCTVLE